MDRPVAFEQRVEEARVVPGKPQRQGAEEGEHGPGERRDHQGLVAHHGAALDLGQREQGADDAGDPYALEEDDGLVELA